MANVKWNKLQQGDFFTVNFKPGNEPLLYQKIERDDVFHNAVLLNTGQICHMYIGPESTFEKVEVTFSFNPIE